MASGSARRCLVIGAGVVGASIAARLAGSGVRVTLLDRDRPGQATSRWSFAWLNSNHKTPRHYHDLNHAGIRAWADLAADAGLDGAAWYRPVGHLEVANTDATRTELTARVRRLAGWGYSARLIDAAEAARLEPALRPVAGAASAAAGTASTASTASTAAGTAGAATTTIAWFAEEGYLLTEPLIDRLVAYATSRGAVVLTGDQGRVIAVDAGRVRTAAGEVLRADDIVCCAGRWTPEVAAMADAGSLVPLTAWDTPGATAPGLVVRAGPVAPPGPVRILHTPELSLRPHSGGLVQLEAADAAVDLHTSAADLRRWAAELLSRARATIRGLDHAEVVDHRVCVRPMPADGQSIVGRLPGAGTCYVAVTHSGVTLGAHLARLIADDLTGTGTGSSTGTGSPPPELAPYRPARFRAERKLS
ncbi:MAG: FAD-binding oxidoreductase [Streptosporangiaceae bacterium]|nr:FAD-binding oxidoreductase [Streptosporangiaceae bacterium]